MAVTRQAYRVYYEDGREVDVLADQRDVVVFERAAGIGFNKAMETMTITAVRQVAFYALKRTGQVPPGLTARQWDDTVIEVEPDPDNDEAVDPTRPEASQTGPSD